MDPQTIQTVEEIIGHTFFKKELLVSALTTNAYLEEHKKDMYPEKDITHYKILEPIGDSVLDLIVTSELSKLNRNLNDMEKARNKDRYVAEKNLHDIAKRKGLNNYLRMGNGEIKKDIKNNKKICDALVEALIAAVYLDSIDSDGKVDMKEVRKVVVDNLGIFKNNK